MGALAWQTLTGCQEQWSFSRSDDGSVWRKAKLDGKRGNPRDFQKIYSEDSGDTFDMDAMFNRLHDFANQHFLLGAVIPQASEVKRDDGLVGGHAYAILRVQKAGRSNATKDGRMRY